MKRFIYTISLLLATQFAFAQSQNLPCGTDELYKEMLKQNPQLQQQMNQYNEGFLNYLKTVDLNSLKAKPINASGKTSTPKYIIPVVFHVLHNNGIYGENYSDQQVKQEIINMNASYSANNPFRSRIRAIFKDVEGDAQIEFRLARKDPNGNATTGIEHIYIGPMTAKAFDFQKKNSWNPAHYLNIWTCKSLRDPSSTFAVGGYAYFPNGFLSAAYDGPIVCNAVGVTPSNAFTPFDLATCAHEVGHYLGLLHPFNGSNTQDSSCGEDFCSDVPPVFYIPTTAGNQNNNHCSDPNYNSCSTDNPDLPDQQENIMDYFGGSCDALMFSIQQVARMHFTLENYRRDLWQTDNLIATGVIDTTPLVTTPIAAFSILNNQNLIDVRACVNTALTFRDNSYNGTVTKWHWDFGDGMTQEVQTPATVTYTTPGKKTVSLTVTGTNGQTSTKTITDYITIEGPNDALNGSVHVADWDWGNTSYLTDGWHFENEWPYGQWTPSTLASYDGNSSLELASNSSTPSYNSSILGPSPVTYYPQIMHGFNYAIISPPINFTGASTPFFQFYYAFAATYASPPQTTPSQDALSISVSSDCGKTWSAAKTVVGGSAYYTNAIPQQSGGTADPNLLGTNPSNTATPVPVLKSLNFIPTGATQWKKMSVVGSSLIPAQNNVKFKILFSCDGGNNLYIDKLSLGMSSGTIGINEITKADFQFGVKPNPFNDLTQLTYLMPAKANVEIRIFDIVGKEVGLVYTGTQEIGLQAVTIDRNKLNLNSGLYFVKMIVDHKQEITQKVVVN